MTRGRVVFITVLALASLDVGRSLWARRGFAQPRAVWRPDPAEFASIAWPPGADAKPGLPLGQRIFLRRCQTCHGPDGRGNGPAAPSMSPRPRNFTRGQFKYKSTPPGAAPADADLMHTVRDGLRASAMPYFGDLVSEDELRAVVAYVRSLGPSAAPAAPIPVPPRVPADAASLERGQAVYGQSCAACHGADGRAQNLYDDQSGRQVAARDLTAPWTFRGGAEPEQVWLRLTTGLATSAMPAFADALTAGERWDVVNYVLSIARTPPWEPGGRLLGPGHETDPVRRGDYLAHYEMCSLCHTQIEASGIYRESGFFLAGGMRVGAWPHPNFISRNLTSDAETGLGRQSVEQIARTIRDGRRFDRVLDPWGMPWFILHALREDDARALATYLKTLPPVSHFVPAPLEYGFVETLVGKLSTPLPPATPRALTYADGDFADAAAPRWPREWPQRALRTAQWVVLTLGLVAFAFAGPPPRRRWVALLLGLGAALLALVAWLVVGLPQVIPPELLARGVIASVPRLDTAGMPPHQAALIERGAYLFKTASCLFCHGNDGAGGNKIDWKPFGTLYARNVSSDRETGIGAWSDTEVARAIRSGVSRDGRQLHWQGMTWDLLSNLDEEDVRAVIAYLRTLPPVRKSVPPPRPPAPDDCAIYTFYVRGSFEPGCR